MKKLIKIIEYGLYLLVFLLPLQVRWIIHAGSINNGYWEYGTISLYAIDILLLALLILFAIFKFKNFNSESQINYKLQIPIYWWLIAGLEFAIFISIFIASNKWLAVYKYVWFLLGVGLFWLITEANYNYLKLLYAFLSGVILSAGLGIYQFLFQTSFACKWLGLAVHNPSNLGVSVVQALNGGRWLRAYGSLDHPNMLGGFMVIGILLIIESLIKNKQIVGYQSRSAIKNYLSFFWNFRLVYFLFFCFLIFTSALFFSFSRGAWIGLALALLVIFIIIIIKKDFLVLKKILSIILTGGILFFLLFNLYSGLTSARLSQNNRLEIKSITEREQSYQLAWRLIKRHWLLGVGIGNYSLVVSKEISPGRSAWYYQPVHNVFLLVWAEIGVLGLFFFLTLLCSIFYTIYIDWRVGKNEIYKISLIIALVIMIMVDHWFWSLHFGVLLFWFILGIGNKKKTQKNQTIQIDHNFVL